MFPTKHCFEENNKKDKSPCSLKRYDGPVFPHLRLTTRVISSVHVTFCGSSMQRLLKKYLEKILIGRKSRARGTLHYVIYGKNNTFLNEIDSKRTSNQCFRSPIKFAFSNNGFAHS